MGLGDLFKASENAQLKQRQEELEARVRELEAILPADARDLDQMRAKLQEVIDRKQNELETIEARYFKVNSECAEASKELTRLQEDLIVTKDELLFQSFGLYEPQFDFATSSEYKTRLELERKKQKDMIRAGTACIGNNAWTVNGSASQGKKMLKDMQKLLLRAFNSECDELISKVRFNNFDSYLKRMISSGEAISKLGKIMSIKISDKYLHSKTTELALAHEYQQKKQEEKEALKQLRAEQREQAKLEREIEAARKKLEKEQSHCQNALAKMLKQDTSSMSVEEKSAFDAKKAELEAQLGEIAKGIADVDYRSANQRAGYVYVISNVGSFGENIYKIGMTRRLDPMDRVDELGDASVPFNFDVHAMIFSEDAPALETALHKAFEERKVNMVNSRREFFNVTLAEIQQVIKDNFDKTVEFTEIAPAEQYRESKLMREKLTTVN